MALSKNSKILASDVTDAIKSITRSGTTFTYTTLGGSTGTFTQQDNNTTYSAGTGISISSNTITNTGVTSVNGKTGAVTVSTGTATAVSGVSVGSSTKLPSGGQWKYFAYYSGGDSTYAEWGKTGTVAGGTKITGAFIAIRVS